MKAKKPIFGAHVSVAGGIQNGISRAESIGAEAIQIHASSPRRWAVVPQKKSNVNEYKERIGQSKIQAVFLHAPYLINLVSSNDTMLKKSVDALTSHMRLADELGARGVVVHMGSVGIGNGKDDAAERAAKAIKKVLANSPGASLLILENASGGGGKFGTTAKEMGKVIKMANSDRLCLCVDTAHAFGAGELDFTPAGIKQFFKKYEDEVGKGKISLLHINDSKAEFGSLKDRHENLGDGLIGMDGFRALANEEAVTTVPWILEVPGIEGGGPDSENMARMRSLFK